MVYILSPFNRSTPVGALHTKVLGTIKYVLEELMPKMNARHKKERLRAFNTSGMWVSEALWECLPVLLIVPGEWPYS